MYKFGLLLIVSYACSTSALPPCVCARDFHPVCGSDGQTYPNSCMLTCATQTHPDLTLARQGSCDQPQPSCICTFEYKPVCGIDGTTYPNHCALGCERARNPILEKQYDGPCREETPDQVKVADIPQLPTCACTRNLQPVCGTDGETYSNICLLKCAAANKPLAMKSNGPCDDSAVKVAEQPEELKSCTCTRNYVPVCGSDGVTYPNPCMLGCKSNTEPGLRMARMGPC